MAIELTHVHIQGFKSIKDAEVELGAMNVIIGANGAGKSNFIEVFNFVRNIYEQNLQGYVINNSGADNIIYSPSGAEDRLGLHFYFSPHYYKIFLKKNTEDQLYIARELAHFVYDEEDIPHSIIITEQANESRWTSEKDALAQYVMTHIEKWQVYHFHDTGRNANIKRRHDLADNVTLAKDGGNLAPFLFRLKRDHQGAYERIVSHIKLTLPFFQDFVLLPEGINEDNIILRWKQKGKDKVFGAPALSDGSLRYICLATLLLQPQLPQLIIIDEPELGLHPTAILHLAALLRSASHFTQIIVSTQSVDLVNEFQLDQIIVAEHSSEGTKLKRFNKEDYKVWLDEYSTGDIWNMNIIGGQP